MALTSQQLQQLQIFSDAGDRVNYYTYLGSYLTQQGMDRRYADLALGVVLDNTPAGKLANDFLVYSAQRDGITLSAQKMYDISVDLMRADIRERQSDSTLASEVNFIRDYHSDVFVVKHQLSASYWTAFNVLEAQGDSFWNVMLTAEGQNAHVFYGIGIVESMAVTAKTGSGAAQTAAQEWLNVFHTGGLLASVFDIPNPVIGTTDPSGIVYGTSAGDTILGTAANNGLFGNDGNDTIVGSNGVDGVYGGNGTDTMDYSAFTQAVNVNAYQFYTSVTKASGVDYLSDVEQVKLTSYDDTITVKNGFGAGDAIVLTDTGGTNDRIIFESDVSIDNLNMSLTGSDLNITTDQGGSIVIKNYTTTGKIESIQFDESSGTPPVVNFNFQNTYSINQTNISQYGGVLPSTNLNDLYTLDNIGVGSFSMGAGDDFVTVGRSNTNYSVSGSVYGYTGNDTILLHAYGSVRNNEMSAFGGDGDDFLHATGHSTLNGDAGNDTFSAVGTLSALELGGPQYTNLFRMTDTGGDERYILDRNASYVIIDYSGADTLKMADFNSVQDFSLVRSNQTARHSDASTNLNGLFIEYTDKNGAANYAKLTDQLFSSSTSRIENLQLADNSIVSFSTLKVTTYGSENADTINGITVGASQDDTIYGYGGNDTLVGGSGNDVIYGGDGNDGLEGNSGNNVLVGGAGDDVIYAYGNDIVVAGSGNDTLYVGLDISPASLIEPFSASYTRTGTSLNIFLSDGRHIRVDNQFVAGGASDERLETLRGVSSQAINLTTMATPNAGPIAQDDTFSFTYGQLMVGNVLINNGAGADIDLDGDTLTATLLSSGLGAVVLSSNGSFTYTAASNFSGTDSFTYTVSDGFGGQDTGTVTLNISANQPPVAKADFFSAFTAQASTGNLLVDNGAGADTDLNNNALSVVAGTIVSTSGGAAVILANGNFSYTSAVGFTGRDTFTYTVQDSHGATATAVASIQVANDSINNLVGTSGNDLFNAYGGSDTVIGGDGNDTIIGGFGADTASYENAASGVTVSLVITGAQNTVAAGLDTLVSVENLTGSGFADTLTGDGLANKINGNDGNDTLDGGAGADTFRGGYGNDTIYGGDDADIVLGEWGNDTLYGGAGDDNIKGGTEDDVLYGDDGVDIIRGENGNDALYGGASDIVADGSDQQLWGGAGNDTIYGGTGFDIIRGDSGKDVAYGGAADDDINGGAGDDSLYGDDGNDEIHGGTGDDIIVGGAGNDKIYGEEGQDILDGGEGDDDVRGGIDSNIVRGGAGNDDVYGGSIGGSGDISGNDELYGDAGNDRLFAGAGDDSLDGGAGNDELRGLEGNDTYRISAGADYILDISGTQDTLLVTGATDANDLVFSNISLRNAADTNNLVISWNAGVDSVEIENQNTTTPNLLIEKLQFEDGYSLTLGRYTTWMKGTSAAAVTNGTSADNTILGYGGDDTISGLDGHDEIHGGDGNDTVSGGNGNDLLHGGRGDDVVNGDAGNDTLYGGAGINTLAGGADNDTYVITSGTDTITETSGTDMLKFVPDISLESLTFTNTGADDVTITSTSGPSAVILHQRSATAALRIDTIVFEEGFTLNFADYSNWKFATSTGGSLNGDNNNATGVDVADTIIGGIGIDTLRGYDMNDTIYGGANNDTIFGGNGNDVVHGGSGDDIVKGDAGQDTVYGGDGNDKLYGETNASDTTGDNDTLYGGAGDDEIYAGVGNDTMFGGDGVDIIRGQAGIDTISGGKGNDDIDGGDDNDIVNGDDGDDAMSGGNGDDVLHGGFGADNIVGNNGIDVVYGDSGDDVLNGSAGVDTVYGGAGNDTIYGGATNTAFGETDYLYGDDGDDIIKGQDGNDVIYGGAGADTIQGDTGVDTLYGGADGDVFMFLAASAFSDIGGDIIKDFVVDDGMGGTEDMLNIADLLVGYNATTSAITDFLQMTTSGADTLMSVDRDGTGSAYSFQQVAKLEGIAGLTDEAALLAAGNIVV